jgi:hypothetical protein
LVEAEDAVIILAFEAGVPYSKKNTLALHGPQHHALQPANVRWSAIVGFVLKTGTTTAPQCDLLAHYSRKREEHH